MAPHCCGFGGSVHTERQLRYVARHPQNKTLGTDHHPSTALRSSRRVVSARAHESQTYPEERRTRAHHNSPTRLVQPRKLKGRSVDPQEKHGTLPAGNPAMWSRLTDSISPETLHAPQVSGSRDSVPQIPHRYEAVLPLKRLSEG
jgi:hypothetical protein